MEDPWVFENWALQSGFAVIAGIDEAGRGPLAGPVLSAAVILPRSFSAPGLTDSKKLSPRQRDRFYNQIYAGAVSVGIGIVDVPEIDRINILQASLRSMHMAVSNLKPVPDVLLIDGNRPLDVDFPQRAVPRGDSLSISIAAASVVAKVTRDRIMACYDADYPQYGFSRHKGYPTLAHRTAIQQHGHCPIHRRTFKGVKEHIR